MMKRKFYWLPLVIISLMALLCNCGNNYERERVEREKRLRKLLAEEDEKFIRSIPKLTPKEHLEKFKEAMKKGDAEAASRHLAGISSSDKTEFEEVRRFLKEREKKPGTKDYYLENINNPRIGMHIDEFGIHNDAVWEGTKGSLYNYDGFLLESRYMSSSGIMETYQYRRKKFTFLNDKLISVFEH